MHLLISWTLFSLYNYRDWFLIDRVIIVREFQEISKLAKSIIFIKGLRWSFLAEFSYRLHRVFRVSLLCWLGYKLLFICDFYRAFLLFEWLWRGNKPSPFGIIATLFYSSFPYFTAFLDIMWSRKYRACARSRCLKTCNMHSALHLLYVLCLCLFLCWLIDESLNLEIEITPSLSVHDPHRTLSLSFISY